MNSQKDKSEATELRAKAENELSSRKSTEIIPEADQLKLNELVHLM